MAALAGSLGLDRQVHILLYGGPLERAVARVVVRRADWYASKHREDLANRIANIIGGGS